MNAKSVAAWSIASVATLLLAANLVVNSIGVYGDAVGRREAAYYHDWQRLQYLERQSQAAINRLSIPSNGQTNQEIDNQNRATLKETSDEIDSILSKHPEWRKQAPFR